VTAKFFAHSAILDFFRAAAVFADYAAAIGNAFEMDCVAEQLSRVIFANQPGSLLLKQRCRIASMLRSVPLFQF